MKNLGHPKPVTPPHPCTGHARVACFFAVPRQGGRSHLHQASRLFGFFSTPCRRTWRRTHIISCSIDDCIFRSRHQVLLFAQASGAAPLHPGSPVQIRLLINTICRLPTVTDAAARSWADRCARESTRCEAAKWNTAWPPVGAPATGMGFGANTAQSV